MRTTKQNRSKLETHMVGQEVVELQRKIPIMKSPNIKKEVRESGKIYHRG